MSILVVEDDNLSRKLIVAILEKSNFSVVAKPAAADAWEYLESGEPCELIITDMMMPVMDGLTLIRKIKNDRRFRRIPIFLCTSLNDKEIIVKGIQAGVAEYIVKPVRGAVLIPKINECLEKRDGAILVVDDERLIRDLLAKTLRREGWPVVAAESGEQALEIMQTTKVQVVVSDIVMPEMDGFELLSSVKKVDPKLPVILISGRAGRTREDVMEAGADDFIPKPFNNTEVISRVGRFYD